MRSLPRLALAASVVLLAIACSDSPTNSGAPTGSGRIGLSPSFTPAASLAYSALSAFGLDITSVHVRLTAPDGSTRDTTIAFPVGVDTLRIDLSVPLRTAGEMFRADLELRDAQGQVLFSGTQQVVAHASNVLGGGGGPAIVQLQYTGPGSTAKSVTVTPVNPSLVGTGTVGVTAAGADLAGVPVQNMLVAWTSSDATVATVTSTGNTTATVTSTGKRGTATITAVTPLNISGTTRVSVTPVAARLVVISGGGQTAPAGTMLAQPLIVEVQAADNLPVAGSTVAFRAITTGGSVTTASVIADANGRASSTLRLGPTAGAYQFEAASGALPPVTAGATATPAPAATLAIVSGDAQSAPIATTLPQPLAVKVFDQFGAVVSGATVQWTKVTGGGALGAATSTTGSNGIATNTYTLGTAAGGESVRASLPGVTGTNSDVVFTAVATGGAPARITGSGSGQHAPVGTPLIKPLIVRVTDAFNNPVANVNVVWSLTGNTNVPASFAPPVSTTDVNGFAETTVTMGNTPGPLTITAIVNASLTFQFSAVADPGTQGNSPGTLSGYVYDAVGNGALGGVTVTITPSGQTTGGVTVQTAVDGRYLTTQLAGGLYDVVFALSGKVTTTIVAQRVNGNTVAQAVPMVPFSTSPGSVSGTIIDATTNRALTTSVTVELRAGLNALTGPALQTVQTNTAAQYVFTNISAGTYTVLARATGYTDASKTGISVGATTTGNQNVFISPLTSAGAVRIVLTWRPTPGDLDSHLTGPTGVDTVNRFHVYYGNRATCTSSPFACLDQDVTSGRGPETMTISQVFPGRYRYGVQNYSCCGNGGNSSDLSLSQSGAVVEVYINNTLVQSFSVPSGAGSFWTVFELNGTVITPINTIVSSGAFTAVTRIPSGSSPTLPTDDRARILNDIRAHPKAPGIPR